jgi:mannitol-specific phosphotransferase system IIBC component
MMSVVHFSGIIVEIYFYYLKLWPYTIPIAYIVVPFKDGCIALMITRLYYYQGTSEKRNEKEFIEKEDYKSPKFSNVLNNET